VREPLLIKILTIFPEMFSGPLTSSILKRAQEQGLLKVEIVNIREFSEDRHLKVDDYPFGGGAGMVMKPEPFFRCLEALKPAPGARVILLTPQGKTFNQGMARELAEAEELILICGHYEGIDERVRTLVTDEISLGDFILTGGEIAAMAIVDCVGRLIPGVVGDPFSLKEESFNNGLLEYPQYTRPRLFRGMEVPGVLLSGNHREIERWRRAQAVRKTFLRRPDLLGEVSWDEEDMKTVNSILTGEAPPKAWK
jgi:tRNA (guanine37-N1)-methyltransferase